MDSLTDRLKDQVTDSVQDALVKATSVLSNLHRVKSYMEVLANLPVSRAGEVIKCAVEQVQGMKEDSTSLLQTVYLTEIGLSSLQVCVYMCVCVYPCVCVCVYPCVCVCVCVCVYVCVCMRACV